MVKKSLQEALTELQATLGDVERVDEETRTMVESLTDDLNRLLGSDAELSAQEVQPVSNRLQELLLRFETQHPQVTGILGRLADILSNVGI